MEKIIGKYKIEVLRDEYTESPDNWEDEARFIVYDHRQFYVRREGFDPREINDDMTRRKMYKGFFVFPLYAYIHSGVALSVDNHNFPYARWDVSMCGWVLIKKEAGSYTRKKALEAAKGLTESWNQYLSGEVYGYKITDIETEEEIDSCWGFYGGEEYCMTNATEVVEYTIKKDKHGQLELEMN